MVTTFIPLYAYGDLSRRSRAANSAVPSQIESIQDVMAVLFTCNNEDPIKNEGARAVINSSLIITQWELSVAMETRVLV